jgi:hypothetical protein
MTDISKVFWTTALILVLLGLGIGIYVGKSIAAEQLTIVDGGPCKPSSI